MGHVYILEAKVTTPKGMRLVKIGHTSRYDVNERINEIKAEWLAERKIKVIKLRSHPSNFNETAESAMHQTFREFRQYGEYLRQQLGGECSGDTEWFLMPSRKVAEAYKELQYQASIDYSQGETCQLSSLVAIGLILILIAAIGSVVKTQATAQKPQQVVFAEGYTGANLRQSPNGARIGYLANGSKVEVLETAGEWCRIDRGWVYCRFITHTTQQKPASLN